MPHSLKKMCGCSEQRRKRHQLTICLPSSCPMAPGSHRRLPQLGHSFLLFAVGVSGVLEPPVWAPGSCWLARLPGSTISEFVLVAGNATVGMLHTSCLFHHSLAHHSLRGPPRTVGPFPSSWQRRGIDPSCEHHSKCEKCQPW